MFRAISHRWHSSFRFKLILATVVMITLTVTIYSGSLFWRHARATELNQKERATRLASQLAESLSLPMYEFNALAVAGDRAGLPNSRSMHACSCLGRTGLLR